MQVVFICNYDNHGVFKCTNKCTFRQEAKKSEDKQSKAKVVTFYFYFYCFTVMI
ncbi:unnamed protein product [Camellia sinensis]